MVMNLMKMPSTKAFLNKALALRLVLLLVTGHIETAHIAQAQAFSLPNDVYLNNQNYLNQINYNFSKSDLSLDYTVVAVIDEGVDWTHEDLKNQMWKNMAEVENNKIDDDKNGYVDDVYGWNFLDKNSNVEPKGGHGTMLAGIIGAESNNQIGIKGIANKVKIMPLTVCAKDFGCDQKSIINAIYYAVNNGAKVINLSLGDTEGFKPQYNDVIKYAYSKNVVIVAAAGGSVSGLDLSKNPLSPICNDNGQNMVLGVGTVDENNIRPVWAHYGLCVDVSAPGKSVFTTTSKKYRNGNLYESVTGNSFSTAMVSGLAAEIFSYNPNLTSEQVIKIITTNSAATNFVLNANSSILASQAKVLGLTYAGTFKQKLVVR